MTIGEKRFSTQGQQAVKQTFPVLPAKEWLLLLRTEKAQVAKAQGVGKFPRVDVRFEAIDSATKEGGKNLSIFHMFFCANKEQKNGVIMTFRADQVVGFAKAIGQDFDAPTVTMQDEDGNDVEVIQPQHLLQWLKNLDGTIVKARTKVQKGTKEYPNDKAVIDYFVETEQAEGSGFDTTNVEPQAPVEEPAEEEAPALKKAVKKPAAGKKGGR